MNTKTPENPEANIQQKSKNQYVMCFHFDKENFKNIVENDITELDEKLVTIKNSGKNMAGKVT